MYTLNQNRNILCECCFDPARFIKKQRLPYWPFKTISLVAYCYECYQEVIYGKLPKVTDPSTKSRRGSGVKKRRPGI